MTEQGPAAAHHQPHQAPVEPTPDQTDGWLDLWPAPKEPWRRRALRALIPTLVLVLVTAGIAVSARYTYRPVTVRDRSYAPVDGRFSQISLNDRVGQLEQGIGPGSGVLGLGFFGEEIAQRPDHTDWIIDHDLWYADARTEHGWLRLILTMDAESLSLIGISGFGISERDEAVAFSPALTVSRGRVVGAQANEQHGRMIIGKKVQSYAATVRVTGQGDCLSWTAAVGGGGDDLDLDMRLCRDQGLQELRYERGTSSIRLQVTGNRPPSARFDGSVEPAILDRATIADWRPQAMRAEFTDATGTWRDLGDPLQDPAMLADGHFAVFGYDEQVVVLRAGDRSSQRQWVAHPGGRVIRMLGAGDLLIVATDQRRVLAYDLSGRRVWQRTLADLVADAVVSGDRLVMTIFGAAVISLDLRTGRQLWQHQTESILASDSGVAAGDDIVAFADATSDVHALEADTGELISSAGGGIVYGLEVVGREVISLSSSRLYRQPIDDGLPTRYAINTGLGANRSLHLADGVVVVSGERGVKIMDALSGEVLARHQPAEASATGPRGVLLARDGISHVVTADQPQGRGWNTPLPTGASLDVGLGDWGAVLSWSGEQMVIR